MKRFLKKILLNNNFVQLLLLKLNSRENKEILKKRVSFYRQFINKNDLVFDVGANIGNRTKPLLDIGARVVAIEPQESCYNILKSKFGNKIEIVAKGLGEAEGTKDFFIANAHTISSFSNEWIDSVKKHRFKDYTWDKAIKVQITTLDCLLQQYGTPAFIKIDVEGYELEVLKGLTTPINLISFEYTVPEQTQKVIDCINQIEKHNQNIECNYSKGESMELYLPQWLNANDFKTHILTKEFMSSDFGDVYVKSGKI